MKIKEGNVTYNFAFMQDKLEPEIRWVVCQHCKKPVYGTRTGGVFSPTKKLLTKWEFKTTKKKKRS